MDSSELAEAFHIKNDISVNEFTHSAWTRTKPVQLSHYWSGAPAPVHRHAEARLLWSDTALYVRFTYPQKEPLIVSPSPRTTVKTLELWDRDVCEIFIAPNPKRPNEYFEFEAAPTGEWVDLAIQKTAEGRITDFDFQSGMTAAAEVASEQIRVGIRIPWSKTIRKPHKGEKWRINLFRCVGSDPDRGYVTWRPTFAPEPNFHVPTAFGWLLFRE